MVRMSSTQSVPVLTKYIPIVFKVIQPTTKKGGNRLVSKDTVNLLFELAVMQFNEAPALHCTYCTIPGVSQMSIMSIRVYA